ncbi:hypothetical protein [Aeromicrobium massiliense]|uniref:hypothetical protein n=1 Tax=Aeromicrobium massiliense TaxID=1464554 RepID=UPI00031A4643|nr:hypothetical protein [Aeromicrobium massiliense]
MSATHPVAARAHRNALQLTPQDLVTALNSKLGAKIVAFIAGKTPSTVSRWAAGQVTPDEDALRPLRTAHQVFEMLEAEDSDHTIRAWFVGMNPQLDDVSPAEALRDGELREVMAAARAFHAGG